MVQKNSAIKRPTQKERSLHYCFIFENNRTVFKNNCMNETDRQRLEEKKKQVQAQQQVKAQSERLAAGWLPTLQLIQQKRIAWRLEYFICTTGLTYTHWKMQLGREPWQSAEPNKLLLLEKDEVYVHNELVDHYPNHHPLRYVPELQYTPGENSWSEKEILTEAFEKLGFPDQPVYFFCMRLPPVLILRFSDIIKLAGEGLLKELEDICITPVDYSWLIFRSLEDEWQFGYKE
jgi:hypothetical protein